MKSNRPSKWKVLLVGLFFSEAIVGLVGPVSSPVEATESSGDIQIADTQDAWEPFNEKTF